LKAASLRAVLDSIRKYKTTLKTRTSLGLFCRSISNGMKSFLTLTPGVHVARTHQHPPVQIRPCSGAGACHQGRPGTDIIKLFPRCNVRRSHKQVQHLKHLLLLNQSTSITCIGCFCVCLCECVCPMSEVLCGLLATVL